LQTLKSGTLGLVGAATLGRGDALAGGMMVVLFDLRCAISTMAAR